MANINWTMGSTYWGTNSWETIGTITTGSKTCSSVTCTIPMGTGSGNFTAGNNLTGRGNALSITCRLNGITSTNTVSNIVGTSSYSGGTYPDPNDLQNYNFKFSGTFAANTTYTLQVMTPACSNGGVGDVLCIGDSGTYTYAEVADNITITFSGNGGTISPTSKTIESGSSVGTLPTGSYPVTLTYDANGGAVQPSSTTRNRPISSWNTKSDGSGTAVTSSTKFTQSTTVYAIWGNATLGDLPTPTRANCRYRRWTSSKNGDTAVSASTTIRSNTTIYADWQYKLTYYGNGGSPASEYEGREGDNIVQYKNYGANTLGDYAFSKLDDDDNPISTTNQFNTTASGSGQTYISKGSITITQPTSLYAIYGSTSYNVKFEDGYSGAVLKSQTVSYGGSATPPPSPTRAGYTFSGWLGNYTNVKRNETVKAIWGQSPIWYRKGGRWVSYKPTGGN